MATATLTRPTTTRTPEPAAEAPAIPPFRRVKSETLVLSADQARAAAETHQSLPHSPTERTLEAKRVNELLTRIRGGIMLPFLWAVVVYRGVKYRMNGMHSSQALLDCGDMLPREVVIHFDTYEAPDAQAMGVLFRQFDARMSSRSKQDVSGAYQGLVEEIAACNRANAKMSVEGIGWYERAIEGLPVSSGDDLYDKFLLKKYHGFIRWADKIISVKTPELKRAPILGAMYATFITSESGAQEFWAHAAKGDLTDDSDPRAVLSAELVRIKEAKGGADTPKPADFYAKCVKAWNAFRGGEKIRSLNVNVKKGLPEIAA